MGTDSRRQRLKMADTRDALEAVKAGARLVVVRPLPLEGGKLALPGEDVTAQAKAWPILRTLVQRGHLRVVLGSAGAAPPAPTPAPSPAAPTPAGAPADPSTAPLPPRRRR